MIQTSFAPPRVAIAAVVLVCSSALIACEGDSFGYSTRKLPTYGAGSGAGSGERGTGTAPAPSSSSSSQSSGNPAPSTQPSDAGSQVDSSAPPSAPAAPGTCGNPRCVAAAGLCGCKATNAAGDQIVMGCQDGACACLDANGNDTNDFQTPCDDQASAALAFQACACN